VFKIRWIGCPDQVRFEIVSGTMDPEACISVRSSSVPEGFEFLAEAPWLQGPERKSWLFVFLRDPDGLQKRPP
jgi:hypothetical protein